MARRVARGSYPGALEVLKWPIREALLALWDIEMEAATARYYQLRLEYALAAPWSKDASPPDLEPILTMEKPRGYR